MKLVWLVNTILPQIAKAQGRVSDVIGGWTVQLADMLSSNPDIDFTLFYPQHDSTESVIGRAGEIKYVGFYEKAIPQLEYDPEMTERIRKEIKRIQPDIVHIWGSEFVHCLSMVRAFNKPEKTVISIQGLIYYWGLIYESDLPEKIVNRHTFRDFIRKDSIAEQKEKFLKRGECEISALKEVKHAIGRTGWDRKAVTDINPEISYHHGGEILRKEFYDSPERWSAEKAEKHRIFMSQSYYPVKGIHFALAAVKEVKKKYPDIKLAVTGKDMRPDSLKDRIKQDSYGKYICDIIKNYELEDNVEFLGPRNASEMVKEYLKCSIFLLPSSMENSSNSLGEAMMLGVPCVASNAGGTPDMIGQDEGWLYKFNDISALCGIIMDVFSLIDRASCKSESELNEMLKKAFIHASKCYDPEKNKDDYLRIYSDIVSL